VINDLDGGAVIGQELLVANTGAPLTAAGVAALASLRASAHCGERGPGPGAGRPGGRRRAGA
jgi:hypothetical protein